MGLVAANFAGDGSAEVFGLSHRFRAIWDHEMSGQHGGFVGRRYRRGKQRCALCGAPLNAPDTPRPDVIPSFFLRQDEQANG